MVLTLLKLSIYCKTETGFYPEGIVHQTVKGSEWIKFRDHP